MKNSKELKKKLNNEKRYHLFSLRNNHEKCILKVWSLLFQKYTYLSRICLREKEREWMEIEDYEKKKRSGICNNIRNIVL